MRLTVRLILKVSLCCETLVWVIVVQEIQRKELRQIKITFSGVEKTVAFSSPQTNFPLKLRIEVYVMLIGKVS